MQRIVALAVLARSSDANVDFMKDMLARNRESSALPDPQCHTGHISLPGEDTPLICCAGYCGECSDYPTCASVRGQDSKNACCKTDVYNMRCGEAPANVCLKSCSESVPPCIMDEKEEFVMPDPVRKAGDDCDKAEDIWDKKADSAMGNK